VPLSKIDRSDAGGVGASVLALASAMMLAGGGEGRQDEELARGHRVLLFDRCGYSPSQSVRSIFARSPPRQLLR
jgi:hypothetical protein